LCNGEFKHHYISTIANRLHYNEDLFPSTGRPSRTQSESFKTAVQKSAKKEEAAGKGLRNVPMTNKNSTAIINSKASLGLIPGTVSEFFLREWKAFVAKEYPNGPPPHMANPLSAYEINKLTDEILPHSVIAKKKDRRNARRTQSQLDGYNYSSGAAGISVIWELEDVEHMDVKDLQELCKKLQIDPDQILNLDKSTALPGNKSEVRDRIQVTPGAKARAHQRKVSIAASADENEGMFALLKRWLHSDEFLNFDMDNYLDKPLWMEKVHAFLEELEPCRHRIYTKFICLIPHQMNTMATKQIVQSGWAKVGIIVLMKVGHREI